MTGLRSVVGIGLATGLAATAATVVVTGPTESTREASPASATTLSASTSATPVGTRAPLELPPQEANAPYDARYHFARVQFGAGRGGGFGGRGRRGGRGAPWAHDYPRADRNFLAILDETTFIDTDRGMSNIVSFDDPELFRHPIIYMVEPGFWQPSPEELENLGSYLRKGGFLIVDDFRGPRELSTLEFYLGQALPELSLLNVGADHEIFDTFFRVDPEGLLPPYGGYPPVYYGVFEDNDPSKRMMVMVNANNDIAEYWEFSDYGYYGIDLSNEAYKVGVNYVVYALTH